MLRVYGDSGKAREGYSHKERAGGKAKAEGDSRKPGIRAAIKVASDVVDVRRDAR